MKNVGYVGDVILLKTVRIDGPGSKRIKNRGESEQFKVTESHPAIITREQFEAVQAEKARRCNVETHGSERSRKSHKYSSKFSIDNYLDYSQKDVERLILSMPFKRYEDMHIMHHSKHLGTLQFYKALVRQLTDEDYAAIRESCHAAIARYFGTAKA